MFYFPIHSPVQEITYNVPNGYQLFIKHDDLIDPIISGNKWRKLKYTLAKARQLNKNKIVSFGGANSNHLLALSSAAAKFGFQSIAFVRGDEVRNDSQMLSIAKIFGMQIIQVSREDYKNKQQLFDEHFKNDEDAYFVDEGGISVEASLGAEEIIDELEDVYSDIFLAAGTGCTSAGIINGITNHNLYTIVHPIVVHHGIKEVQDNIETLLSENSKINNYYAMHDTKNFGRYAKHNEELLLFCIQFARNTGILLDPIYTGKALFKCYDWMKNKGPDSENSKILFLHTGGIWGNLGKIDSFHQYL